MPFRPIAPEKLSATVVRQIEQLILRGILRPGERLPSERELAAKLDVSRPSLREALAVLQQEGLLATRPGAGVFVDDVLSSAFSPALTRLFARHDEAVFDYLSFRRDMEALAARRAAQRASDTDLAVIQTVFDKMVQSAAPHDSLSDAELDAQFHMAIIEASHNVIMLHMMRSMYELLRTGVFYNRQVMFSQHTTRSALLEQHGAINDALQARAPDAAQAAVEAHLDFVAAALRDQQITEQNEDTARLRLDHARVR